MNSIVNIKNLFLARLIINCAYRPVPSTNQQNYHKENLLDKGVIDNLWTVDKYEIKINHKKAIELDGFNFAENEIIEKIMDSYGKLKSIDLVNLAHQDMPWKMTRSGEIIDYNYVFWRETKETCIKNITNKIIDI